MWATTNYLGNFIGPTLAGIITEYFGFRSMTLFFFGSFFITLNLDVIELFCFNFVKKMDYQEITAENENKITE